MNRYYTREEMGYPTEYEMRIPLLRAIGRHGGVVRFSRDGVDVEKELADQFGLSMWQREYSDPIRFRSKGGRAWRNHIQMVRRGLVNEGLVLNRFRDRWEISDLGKRLT